MRLKRRARLDLEHRQILGVSSPRLGINDLRREAWSSVAGNLLRSTLTAIGTVLGAAAFVATLGLSSTLANQVADTFNAQRATLVTVTVPQDSVSSQRLTSSTLPEWMSDASAERAGALNGVSASGRVITLASTDVSRGVRLSDIQVSSTIQGLTPGALAVIEPSITSGRLYDDYHEQTDQNVALLPAGVARSLGVTDVGGNIFILDQAFTVIGIFDDVVRQPSTLSSVVVPFTSALRIADSDLGDGATPALLISTRNGAAQQVASEVTLAIDPGMVQSLRVIAPPDPQTLRRSVEGDIQQLTLVLSAVALAMGAVSIANSATAQIAARRGEIGLRRAVGASPRYIFMQLVGETSLLGLAGGLAGALLGALITIVVSVSKGWVAVLSPPVAIIAALAGALTGALAGLGPAWQATRIEPVDALQR